MRVCLAERGDVGVADGGLEVVIGVLHHGQPALRGGIPLVGLVGEGGILLPRGICGVHRTGHLVCGQPQSLEHIALPDAGQPKVFQHKHGAFALLVQLAQVDDDGAELSVIVRRHAGDVAKRARAVAASSAVMLVAVPSMVMISVKSSSASFWMPSCPAASATAAISSVVAGISVYSALMESDIAASSSSVRSVVLATPVMALSKSIDACAQLAKYS